MLHLLDRSKALAEHSMKMQALLQAQMAHCVPTRPPYEDADVNDPAKKVASLAQNISVGD